MNVPERQARFTLLIFVLTLMLYLILGYAIGFHFGATGAFGLMGLVGFAGLIGRREKRAGKIIYDERDQEIEKSATIAGYSVFWLVLVILAMAPFFILGPDASVTVQTPVFCMLLMGGYILVMGTRALVTVVLYRKANHGE